MSAVAQPLARMTDDVASRVFASNGRGWWLGFSVSALLTVVMVVAIWVLFAEGVGVWGIDIPVAWGFALTNYVWWIAIGMAGTFISGALRLTRQPWRSALSRYAEAMTVFAVSVSGLFPILHLGRPWFFYWLMPYPSRMGVWPQWRSSLVWDFFAIVAYLTFSILLWYVGLIPDLASLRDRARTRGRQVFYGLLALGWRGEARQWSRWETLTLLMAGLAVPLVFSVHSMVALDFSEGLLPGWHSTLFPPFFVAGALFSGFAMALVLGIPLRRWFGLRRYITERHIDNLAKFTLAAGLFVDYSYLSEVFTAFYGMDRYDIAVMLNRFGGLYAWVYWILIACNVVSIQAFWSRRVRANHALVFAIAVLVVIGMWFERFLLVVNSLHQDFLPSSWGVFVPTIWDLALLFGSIGFFFLMFFLFLRWLPPVALAELKQSAAEGSR